jgi:N-acyl-D-aspartate/D-glutamate deacylase
MAPTLVGDAIREIDASGRVVAPGFIDVHTHSDFTLLNVPGADSKVRQGITTEVVGNCGFSPAPVSPQTLNLLKEYVGFLNPHLPWNWRRLGEFYQRVSDQGCAMNIAPLVGHGAIRIAVMGFDNRPPGASELTQMQRLVGEAMEDGAVGLSSGLIYTPGCYGDTSEPLRWPRWQPRQVEVCDAHAWRGWHLRGGDCRGPTHW